MKPPVKPRWVRPRWRKILRDLTGNKLRTLLVVLSISVGVFAVGFVNVTFNILLPDMDADYRSVNPHQAIISAESMTEALIDSLESTPGVADLEGRSAISARVLADQGKKIAITVTALPELDEMKIDLLRSEEGAPLRLGEHEIFLERSSLRAIPAKAGDLITIELTDGRLRQVRVAAIVHDITVSPYVFSNRMSAYTDVYTMEWLEGPQTYNQVYLTVSEKKTDKAHVETVSQRVADKIEKSRLEVTSTYIFQPGRHYASDFISAIGVMLSVLGGLAVLLSAFLVVNTIISLLGQHLPQIGIMKLIGGSAFQIMSMYLFLVFSFGLLAFLIAAPLSLPLGYFTAKAISGFFNFNLGPFRIPSEAILLQLGIALLVPALTALAPVLYGTRITITEAIGSHGLGGSSGKTFIDAALERVRNLPRPLLISFRNAFRRKGRLFLALSTLTLGGAIFISVFNLWAVIDSMMDRTFGYFLSDVNVTLARSYRQEQIQPLLSEIPGVMGVEAWGTTPAQLLSQDGKVATEISIVAPPADSRLIRPVITSGRWLTPQDENALVIGNHLIKERPELKPGDRVTIKIEGKESDWRVVGVYELAGMMAAPVVYANNDYLSALKHETGRGKNFRLMNAEHTSDFEKSVIEILDDKLSSQNIQISQITSRTQIFGGMIASMDAIIYALLVMALLIALVGGLGLTGIMSMNVMERTREIGVMRSVGASDQSILWMVITEGLLIGGISWLFSILFALPLTLVLARVFGLALVNTPLAPAFTGVGYIVWLGIIVVISSTASALPARSASRLTIREVLAYE